jgi:diguanylate cyclase (GGDEF)-like protein
MPLTPAAPHRVAHPEGAGLPRRILGPRLLGFAFGALAAMPTLLRLHAPHAWWGLMLLSVLVWPPLAYLISSRDPAPMQAEQRNIVVDTALAGLFVPVVSFNLMPATLLVSMTLLNCLAVGGLRLFRQGFIACLLGLGVGLALAGTRVDLATPMATVLACLPMMVLYPMTLVSTTYRLSIKLHRQRLAFAQAEQLQHATLDALDAGIVLYDADDRLVLCNERFRRQFPGLDALLQPGQRFEDLLRAAVAHGLVPQARGQEAQWIDERLRAHADPRAAEHRQTADGGWLRVVEQRLPDGSLLAFNTDISDMVEREQALKRLNAERDAYARELRAVNTRLEQLSNTDALTGLGNRRLFDLRLQEEFKRARRHRLPLSLLMVDVDHFKRYNDRHGHPNGDACLRRVAAALKHCAQRSSDLVARYGGEEFALLLPHVDEATARQLAQRCLDAIDTEAIPHGDSPLAPHVTLSLGVATLLPDAGSPDALVAAADDALYRAKQAGRHRWASAEDCAVS